MNESILISTLGSKPQLITLALDCLRDMGESPEAVVVIHASKARFHTKVALEKIERDLAEAGSSAQFVFVELKRDGKALEDITSPEEVETAFQELYSEVRNAKLIDRKVHLLIAGGRRTLTVAGMAAAQMVFDDEDHLWHLASHPALEESGRMHAAQGEWARLIPIPVITWGRLSPVFDVLRKEENPFDAAQKLRTLRLHEQWDRARIFILTKLSPAERGVVELLVRNGLTQNEIAKRLSLSARTVEEHVRSAYRKAEEHWELDSDVRQTQLVRLLNIFFINELRE